jgi:hypothetical protein
MNKMLHMIQKPDHAPPRARCPFSASTTSGRGAVPRDDDDHVDHGDDNDEHDHFVLTTAVIVRCTKRKSIVKNPLLLSLRAAERFIVGRSA